MNKIKLTKTQYSEIYDDLIEQNSKEDNTTWENKLNKMYEEYCKEYNEIYR